MSILSKPDGDPRRVRGFVRVEIRPPRCPHLLVIPPQRERSTRNFPNPETEDQENSYFQVLKKVKIIFK